jgi:hypothetical protein
MHAHPTGAVARQRRTAGQSTEQEDHTQDGTAFMILADKPALTYQPNRFTSVIVLKVARIRAKVELCLESSITRSSTLFTTAKLVSRLVPLS